ncbi:tetrahydromethanopterin S-methyltransferase subunit G [Nocardioides albus]|uniref:Tetrahydromethanopterin S-methyltransferase subunit G n=2 Tax=Nocardioides albus TaxID=1841 RepID=A0A7W5F7T5_9ACTN|nr:tetrahydromethanopterin S-methyltransferase subunit G [Nocardioides albus]
MIDLLTMQQMHTAEFHAIKSRMERTDAAIEAVNARLDGVERRLDDLLISMSQLLNWIKPADSSSRRKLT